MNTSAHTHQDEPGDINIVALWLKKDPTRWVAGALAGVLATAVMLAFAMVLCVAFGVDVWYPIKVGGIPVLGGAATEIGSANGLIVGVITHFALGMFSGIVYAHFTATNTFSALLGMGFVWGTFTWIFITNLYSRAFPDMIAAAVPVGPAFFVNVVFGLALSSVAFFDRALRKK
jgi:hypothetical protein